MRFVYSLCVIALAACSQAEQVAVIGSSIVKQCKAAALPTHLQHMSRVRSITSPVGSIEITSPEGWVLLNERQFTENTQNTLEDFKGKFTDAAIGILYQPTSGADCLVAAFRFDDEAIKESGLSYSFFFDVLATEDALRGWLTGATGDDESDDESVDVSAFVLTQERLGDIHMVREFQWIASFADSRKYGFAEIDMVGPVVQISLCHWQVGVERGDEQAVLFATQDAVRISALEPESES